MEKLFLLDAYALIYRAYYAFIKNPRINSKGFNTSAIMGFVNTLEDVLKKENPTHIGIAFDPAGPTFRHEAFEQYKAQREETPEAIRLSVPIIKDIIRAYRIPILEVSGYEADDVIGTLATEAGKRGITTYMMTPDKDYGQLVSENVFMYRPKYGDKEFEVMGVNEIKAKFDIESPSQVIDMLGLMGDTADNIPGCPGVGEKTAQKLIAQFGSIENLLANTDQLTEKTSKVAENTSEERPATIAEAAIKAVREEKTISETIEGRTSKPQSMTASESPLAVPEGLLQKEQKKILWGIIIAIILVLCIAGGIYWFMQSSSSKQPIRQSIPAATSTVKEMPNDSVTLQQQDTVSGSNLQTREPIQSQPAETPLQKQPTKPKIKRELLSLAEKEYLTFSSEQ